MRGMYAIKGAIEVQPVNRHGLTHLNAVEVHLSESDLRNQHRRPVAPPGIQSRGGLPGLLPAGFQQRLFGTG